MLCSFFRRSPRTYTGHGDHQDEPEAERFRRQAQQLLLPQLLPVRELYDLDSGLHQEEHARYFSQCRTVLFSSSFVCALPTAALQQSPSFSLLAAVESFVYSPLGPMPYLL